MTVLIEFYIMTSLTYVLDCTGVNFYKIMLLNPNYIKIEM